MTTTKSIALTVTERELELIRSALCKSSMRELCAAHEIQRECEEKGYEDTTSHIWMDVRDEIRAIIARIDAE